MCIRDRHKGMYVDFGELKKDLRNLADSMDHALIIEKNSLKQTTLEALKARISGLLNLIFVRQQRIWQNIFMRK